MAKFRPFAVVVLGLLLLAPIKAFANVTVHSDSWPDHQDESGDVWVWSYGSAESDSNGDLTVNVQVTDPDGSYLTSNSESTYGTYVQSSIYWVLRDGAAEGDYKTSTFPRISMGSIQLA